uniref:NADH dehydrogenase [ubiquinone] 1 alpha subcomplex assembly factor 3 n=1 Tax=Panagrolaimus sp. ES5 TaxID=591445 RepID=A0AC34G0A7_9BILA
MQCRKKSDEVADSFHIIPMGNSDVSMQTRVSFLTKDMNDQKLLGIRGYSSVGFRLMDDTFLYGPIAAFPKTCLSWRVLTPDDITPESLELFFMLQPKIDILVIGVGERKDLDAVRERVAPVCKEHKIGLEIMPTEDAISIFNYLNSEMRYVAAALYPPRELHVTDYQYGRALSYLQSWDEIDEHPLLSGLSVNLDNPAVDIVKRLWGEPRPDVVKKIGQISAKRIEEKADHIREGRVKESDLLTEAEENEKKKIDDK